MATVELNRTSFYPDSDLEKAHFNVKIPVKTNKYHEY